MAEAAKRPAWGLGSFRFESALSWKLRSKPLSPMEAANAVPDALAHASHSWYHGEFCGCRYCDEIQQRVADQYGLTFWPRGKTRHVEPATREEPCTEHGRS